MDPIVPDEQEPSNASGNVVEPRPIEPAADEGRYNLDAGNQFLEGLWLDIEEARLQGRESAREFLAVTRSALADERDALAKAIAAKLDVKGTGATHRRASPPAQRVAPPPWVAEVMAGKGLTVGETASRIRKSPRTVYRLINAGRLQAFKQERADSAPYLIPESSVEAYLARLEG